MYKFYAESLSVHGVVRGAYAIASEGGRQSREEGEGNTQKIPNICIFVRIIWVVCTGPNKS